MRSHTGSLQLTMARARRLAASAWRATRGRAAELCRRCRAAWPSFNEAKLRDEVEHLRFALQAARMFTWERDGATGRVTRFGNTEALLGVALDDATDFAELLHPEDRDRTRAAFDKSVVEGVPFTAEFRLARNSEPTTWLRDVGQVDVNGHRSRFIGVCWDITSRKLAEDALRQSEERLAMALDSGSDGLWDWTIDTGHAWYSDRWHTMLGYTQGDFASDASTWLALIHPDDKDEAMRLTTDHFEGRSAAYEAEFRMRTKAGGWNWILSRGKVVRRDADGRPLRIVGTHIDIEARKTAERQIAYMARHDSLTDLANRTLFHERLRDALDAFPSRGGSVAVLCLDLDRFKAVNDAFGHATGDGLLREVARRLRARAGEDDVVARLGGDEFAILRVSEVERPEELSALASALIGAIGEPIEVCDNPCRVGLSVGIALAPPEGVEADRLFKCADLALYRAKKEGRETFRFFDNTMDEAVEERRKLGLALASALANGEFALHYQPLVDAPTGRINGFEALLRWEHPILGKVPPSLFIPIAEEAGLIGSIGDWVLRAACAEAARWRSDVRVAVNISPVQLQRGTLIRAVISALAASGLPASRLELEVTEGALLGAEDFVSRTLVELRQLGVKIALDDFGTGYSSLSYLGRLSIDRIKIDRSFIERLSDPNSVAIVNAIVGLGRQLGMSMTAEGIETAEQFHILLAAGCGEMQGYLFSRPLPAAELPPLLAADEKRRVA